MRNVFTVESTHAGILMEEAERQGIDLKFIGTQDDEDFSHSQEWIILRNCEKQIKESRRVLEAKLKLDEINNRKNY